jgi:ribose transport system permease protein
VLSVATEGRFLSATNLENILHQTAINTILAVGVTFVILTGGIDLSVGSVLALSGVLLGMALHRTDSALVGLLAGMSVGAACGLVNGLATAVGKAPAFVTTLGMMSAARGLTLFLTDGQSVSRFPDSFQMLGLGVVPVAGFLVPAPFLVALTVVLCGAAIVRFTAAGRYMLALGGSEQAARLSGVAVVRYKTLVYTLSGLCAGLGAAVLTAKFNSAQTNAGTGYELDAIAAVVLGGTSLSGGKGSMLGTLSGALLIGVLRNGLNLLRARLGLSPHLQDMVIGAILVLTVIVDHHRRRS